MGCDLCIEAKGEGIKLREDIVHPMWSNGLNYMQMIKFHAYSIFTFHVCHDFILTAVFRTQYVAIGFAENITKAYRKEMFLKQLPWCPLVFFPQTHSGQ